MYDCIRELELNPFKTYSNSDLDKLKTERLKEYEKNKSRAENAQDVLKFQKKIDSLDDMIAEAKKPESFENARSEVLSLITSHIQNKVFYNQAGEALIFEHMADDIIGPAIKNNWKIDADVIKNIDGCKVIKKEDYGNKGTKDAERALKALKGKPIIEWFNESIRDLYTEEVIAERNITFVTESSSFTTLAELFKTLQKRYSEVQNINTFKIAAREFYVVSSDISNSFKEEKTFEYLKRTSLVFAAEKQIESDYKAGKVIDYPFVVNVINDKIAGKGINTKEAVNELERFCLSKGIVADFSNKEKKYVTCGYCGCRFVLMDGAERCSYCHKELYCKCPECGTKNESSNTGCIKCGFSFEFLANIPDKEKTLREEIDRGNDRAVQTIIERLSDYRKYTDEKLLDEAIRFLRDLTALKKELDVLESSKQYYAASKKCESYLRNYPSNIEIRSGYALYKGKIVEVDKKLANVALEERNNTILVSLTDVCSDHPRLMQYFETHRPEAPSSMTADINDEGNISIKISGKNDPDYTYAIVRKKWSSPINENDGETIAVINSGTYVDHDIEYGVEYYYIVFSKRWGVLSKGFAKSSKVVAFADVMNAAASTAEKGICVSFTRPKGCNSVKIYRAENSSPSTSSECINLGSRSDYTDLNATNGNVIYHYLIICEYIENRARSVLSNGVEVSCSPEPLPEHITDLVIEKKNNTFYAKWTHVNYQTELYCSEKFDNLAKSFLPMKELEKKCSAIPTIKNSDGAVSFDFKSNCTAFVYPVVIVGQTALVGNMAVISTLHDISNLRTIYDGDNCGLVFQWPTECRSVKINLHSQHYPENIKDLQKDIVVTKSEYDMAGTVKIPIPFPNTYVKIFAIYDNDRFSNGMAFMMTSKGQLPEISYEITSGLFSKKKYTLKIKVGNGVNILPAMLVRGSDQFMPKKNTAGQTIMEIPETKMGGQSISFDIEKSKMTANIRLYFVDSENDHAFKLIHPTKPIKK